MIDERDKKIISLIQGDLPLDPSPFALLAKKSGMNEDEFIDRVKDLKERGIIRRFGATLRHQEAGFSSNAMVAWLAPDNRIDQIGKIFARFREVSHCYHRPPRGDWPYNLYTMIHGSSREECYRIADLLSQSTDLKDYQLLFSEKEFKKTSMQYFSEKSHGKTI